MRSPEAGTKSGQFEGSIATLIGIEQAAAQGSPVWTDIGEYSTECGTQFGRFSPMLADVV